MLSTLLMILNYLKKKGAEPIFYFSFVMVWVLHSELKLRKGSREVGEREVVVDFLKSLKVSICPNEFYRCVLNLFLM